VPPAAAVLAGAREVTLRSADGIALGAWLVAPAEPRRDVAVLVAAGNAGNRSLRAPLAAALARHGLAVLLFDYRGFKGLSKKPLCGRGQFSERVIVQAALAVGTIGGRAASLSAESV
jgi:predicted alpha/beta hydrolase